MVGSGNDCEIFSVHTTGEGQGDAAMENLTAILYLYSWLAFAFVLVLLFLIARFYEQKSGRRSHYHLFLVPPVAFLLAALLDRTMSDCSPVTDGLMLVAGLLLIALSWRLLVVMTGGRG